MAADDHVAQNMATYDVIAEHYYLTATADLRAWKEASMRRFAGYLPGKTVLVPGCGDGRDSRYLSALGLAVTSFDLSDGMLAIARRQDPVGDYRRLDFRDLARLDGPYDGIWASGCLYHLTKPEFARCVADCHALLAPNGVFYLTMKEGDGERFEEQPGPRYPGGAEAQTRLRGKRFYAYYGRDELIELLAGFALLHEQRVEPSEGGFELWLRRS
jgi:SAM-dependent methyltransferase